MKIRNPTVIRWIGFLGAILIRLWIGSLTLRQRFPACCLPHGRLASGRYIYVFWHENILVPCHTYSDVDIQVLISEHADGEMIAQICKHLGLGAIRGSKTRGGMKALRAMMRAARVSHIAVMPDGPRGPRRHVEAGLVYLAARTGLPIVAVGVGYRRSWRLKTWDRFVVPRPFSHTVVIAQDPILVPADADKGQIEEYQKRIELAINQANDCAERLAAR